MFRTNAVFEYLDPTRVEIRRNPSAKEARNLASDRRIEVLQTARPLKPQAWDALNDEFFSRRPDVKCRVFAYYGDVCDLGFAARMSNVRRFSADCLMEASSISSITKIPNLETLGIGIFELRDLSFLEEVNPTLARLTLGATRSKKPDLTVLNRFRGLKELYLEGIQKNIEVIGGLTELEDVTLRSISTPEVDFLAPLGKMWSLDVKLGGIKSFAGIEGMSGIKYLELWQVMGLAELTFVSTLTGLQYLFLQSLTRVNRLPALDKLPALRRVHLEDMKGLSDMSSLEFAPALEELAFVGAKPPQLDIVTPALRNRCLKSMRAGFGSDLRNNQFDELRRQYGKAALDWEPFMFF